jgi:uncharacterized membrane protein YuzA (DUF378 family)
MPRDLRKYAEQTNIRLIIGGLALLLVVGLGLIYFFHGPGAAMSGMLCILVGLVPLILIWMLFFALEKITKRAQDR